MLDILNYTRFPLINKGQVFDGAGTRAKSAQISNEDGGASGSEEE